MSDAVRTVRKVIVSAASARDAKARGLAEATEVFTLLRAHSVLAVEKCDGDAPPWPPPPRWTVTVITSPLPHPPAPESVLKNLGAWSALIAAIYGPYLGISSVAKGRGTPWPAGQRGESNT